MFAARERSGSNPPRTEFSKSRSIGFSDQGCHMPGPHIIEGRWYTDASHQDAFWVIAVDEQERVVDVRDGFGEIDELDFDEWESLGLELCSSPPEWADASGEED
jgi:hypothetical protein